MQNDLKSATHGRHFLRPLLLLQRCPGRYGTPPAGHYDPDARSSHRAGRKSGEGSAAPEPKIATVRAPRGGRPALWDARRLASAWPAALRAGPPGASQAPVRLSALRHPSIGVREAKKQNPGAENAPRERERLFGMVRYDDFKSGGAARALAPRTAGRGRKIPAAVSFG